jgi:HAD superfamily hydrolase (TIGR01484 family)
MRYLALVTDYDGTLATDGRVPERVSEALSRLRNSGRRAILVTGRRLDDLRSVCPALDQFDFVVLENGAVLFDPRTGEETLLAKPPPAAFVQRLRELGATPVVAGKVVIDTQLPHQAAVLRAIQETGLELHIVFNRNAVMVLPTGVNKATGMDHALRRLGLSAHEVVGVGDAANDHSFLERSECAVAVANAEPAVRAVVDLVTRLPAGDGVVELIDEILTDDLARTQDSIREPLLVIGTRSDGGGSELAVPPYGVNVLVAGPSASGKSTTTTGLIEQLVSYDYQVCVLDPEGDYGAMQGLITFGNEHHAVSVSEVLAFLEDPKLSLSVNLLGIPFADRPAFFSQLFPALQALRIRTGRPHWMILDEAHHVMPPEWIHLDTLVPQRLQGVVFVTVQPLHLAPAALSVIDLLVAIGPEPEKTVRQVARAVGRELVWPRSLVHQPRRAVAWFPKRDEAPFSIELIRGRTGRVRHQRKYAMGDMGTRSFFFTGPQNQHRLRAHNLVMFSQIAEGIDEPTWLYHLRRGDYSRWFQNGVKDRYLADQARRVEQRLDLASTETRRLIRGLIEARYTLPA